MPNLGIDRIKLLFLEKLTPMNTRHQLYASIIAIFLCSAVIAQSKPNILLIVSDDLNTRIGPYMELDRHTPNLDRLANEGVRFTKAYCQYPLCGPSRASFMSGLHPESNGVVGNNHVLGSYRKVTPALSNHPSMAGIFKENGYFSARVSKIYHMGVPGGIERGEPGGDDPDSWDYTYNVMANETLSPGEFELLSPKNTHYGSSFLTIKVPNHLQETQADYLAVSQAIAILENRAGDIAPNATNKIRLKPEEPFFLGVGLVRPHVPFVAPEDCFLPYPADEMEVPEFVIGENVPEQALRNRNKGIWDMTEEQKRKSISGYMASVRFMDQQVGRLLDALDRLELRKNTIVVFISDHGFNLGEHDSWSKVSLWEGSVRVPMIISDPANKANFGSTCEDITELIDLYPTLLDLCDMKGLKPEVLQGKSLSYAIRGQKKSTGNDVAYTMTSAKGASIRTERWRYNRWGEHAELSNEELYDHDNDPEEHVNLVGNPAYDTVLKELRGIFEQARRKARGDAVMR